MSIVRERIVLLIPATVVETLIVIASHITEERPVTIFLYTLAVDCAILATWNVFIWPFFVNPLRHLPTVQVLDGHRKQSTNTADIRLLGPFHRSKVLHAPPSRPTHRGLATNHPKRWLDSLPRSTKIQFRDCYQSPRVDGCLAHKQLRLCQAARRARFPSSRSGTRVHFL